MLGTSIAPYHSWGLLGLSLFYGLELTNAQVLLSRWYSSLANYVISAERIKQFMWIPLAIVEDNSPPSSWPNKGRIELLDLKIRYRPNAPLVLKGITCTFLEGSRIGVVGRTGNGKMTLISALFRLALEKCQLKDAINTLPNLLDFSVSGEGENCSMGQQQLFYLGRVLLRKNKILVLDKAIASIDSATDSIL